MNGEGLLWPRRLGWEAPDIKLHYSATTAAQRLQGQERWLGIDQHEKLAFALEV